MKTVPLSPPKRELFSNEMSDGENKAKLADLFSNYFWFACGKCHAQMEVVGVWIECNGRVIFNIRCPECQATSVRMVDIGDNPYVAIDPELSLHASRHFDRGPDGTRKKIPLKVRMTVLERDQFACQYCGASGKGVQLEVDHVVPWSMGGKDTPDNLVTACSVCNAGKGILPIVPPGRRESK